MKSIVTKSSSARKKKTKQPYTEFLVSQSCEFSELHEMDEDVAIIVPESVSQKKKLTKIAQHQHTSPA